MTEKKMVGLGKFFPSLWLLGAGALGAAALCVYIGAGVLEVEQHRIDFENKRKEHQHILEKLPGMKQEYSDLETRLTEVQSQETALKASIKKLQEQEKIVRNVLAERDSAVAERDEARKTLRSFKDEQERILKEKEQAKKEKLGLESDIAQLKRERASLSAEKENLSASVEKARTELAELQAKKKLNEVVRQEQETLEGFSAQMRASLDKFNASVDALKEKEKALSAQGSSMEQEVRSFREARRTAEKNLADGAKAQKEATETLMRQSEAVTDEARAFSRQIAENRKLVSDVVDGLQKMQNGMAATDKAMRNVEALAGKLDGLRQELETTIRDVAAKKQQLEESTKGLDRERSGVQNSSTSLDSAVSRLREQADALGKILKQLESSPVKNNEPALPAKDPAQEQK